MTVQKKSINTLERVKKGLRNLLKIEFFNLQAGLGKIMEFSSKGTITQSFINIDEEFNLNLNQSSSMDFFISEKLRKIDMSSIERNSVEDNLNEIGFKKCKNRLSTPVDGLNFSKFSQDWPKSLAKTSEIENL